MEYIADDWQADHNIEHKSKYPKDSLHKERQKQRDARNFLQVFKRQVVTPVFGKICSFFTELTARRLHVLLEVLPSLHNARRDVFSGIVNAVANFIAKLVNPFVNLIDH